MLTGPYGALPSDTGEFLLGKVVVTPVFLESNGTQAIETQDWTDNQITQTKAKIQEGMNWWIDTLANVTDKHSLEFVFDFTHADKPVETAYEPIDGSSNSYSVWVNEFLDFVGHNTLASLHDDIRAFNHSQRTAHNADWAFTIFVVDSDEDADGKFASGNFSMAFGFAGGRFIVAPSTRPASTFAHELGHMFWARDEYSGGGSYLDRRGYYNAQNLNAANNPSGQQEPSIMAAGDLLTIAYNANITSTSSMEMLGWRDTDGDGVFDVLDVPHELEANGFYKPTTDEFRLTGTAVVGTLPNQNSSGNQSDITTNEVDRLEYRLDGAGPWMTAANYGTAMADLDVTVDMNGASTIEFRTATYDPLTTELITTSNVFAGGINAPNTTALPGISGFVYYDSNTNQQRDQGELGVANVAVRLTDENASPLPQEGVEPDDFGDGDDISNATPGVLLTAEGFSLVQSTVLARDRAGASTGNRVFAFFLSQNTVAAEWIDESRELVITFTDPTTRVAIDAISNSDGDVGRLEAFNSAGQLIGRYTTDPLANGDHETMEIVSDSADIAWAVATGFANTAVRLDNLQYGAEVTTTTDANGGYRLTGIPDGTHYVQSDASPLPSDLAAVTVAGAPVQGINFASEFTNPWHNLLNRFDATGDGNVTILDLREVFVDFTDNGPRTLDESNGASTRFVDINNDGSLSLTDLRQIFTYFVGEGIGESEGVSWVLPESNLTPLATPQATHDLPVAAMASSPPNTLSGLPGHLVEAVWGDQDDFWASLVEPWNDSLQASRPLARTEAMAMETASYSEQSSQEKNPAERGTQTTTWASNRGVAPEIEDFLLWFDSLSENSEELTTDEPDSVHDAQTESKESPEKPEQ